MANAKKNTTKNENSRIEELQAKLQNIASLSIEELQAVMQELEILNAEKQAEEIQKEAAASGEVFQGFANTLTEGSEEFETVLIQSAEYMRKVAGKFNMRNLNKYLKNPNEAKERELKEFTEGYAKQLKGEELNRSERETVERWEKRIVKYKVAIEEGTQPSELETQAFELAETIKEANS